MHGPSHCQTRRGAFFQASLESCRLLLGHKAGKVSLGVRQGQALTPLSSLQFVLKNYGENPENYNEELRKLELLRQVSQAPS